VLCHVCVDKAQHFFHNTFRIGFVVVEIHNQYAAVKRTFAIEQGVNTHKNKGRGWGCRYLNRGMQDVRSKILTFQEESGEDKAAGALHSPHIASNKKG
jgi:hypothetical protein